MIRAGRFIHKVTLKRKSSDQNEFGRKVEQYIDVFSMRCNCEVINGTELIKSGIDTTSMYISILARYDKRISHDLYIEWKGDIYSLNVVKPSDDLRYMVLSVSREL